MRSIHSPSAIWLLALATLIASASPARAYVPDDRWSSTASGSTGATGDPITLTWSLARDNTSIPGEGGSNLIAYLDSQFGAGPGGANFAQRPWFHIFQESFDRWSQLGGITFTYDPNDSTSSALSGPAGALGVRGDIRIGGANIDGNSGTLAYTYLPSDGDMVVDTGEATFFSTSANNYRSFRNTLMHEIGHAFGLQHVTSSTSALLMEPFIDTSFDGPQLDDVRGIQGMYGDAYERTFSGLGNDVAARATGLGALAVGGTKTIGAAARGSQAVSATETDFVSISGTADADFFSFTLAGPATVGLTLTPLGGVFNQGIEGGAESSFDANARNNLAIAVFGPNGTTQLGLADNTAAGQIESLANLAISSPGQYFVRISGATDAVQLYELALSASSLIVQPSADFDDNGRVDGADLFVWQRTLGATGANLAADANRDGAVNAADLAVWRQQFGGAGVVPAIHGVPEPAALQLALGALVAALAARRRQKKHCGNIHRNR